MWLEKCQERLSSFQHVSFSWGSTIQQVASMHEGCFLQSAGSSALFFGTGLVTGLDADCAASTNYSLTRQPRPAATGCRYRFKLVPVSCKPSLDHDSFGAMLFWLFLGSFLGLGLEAWSCQALLVAASPCLPFAVPSFASSPHRRHRFAIASIGFWAVYFNPEG